MSVGINRYEHLIDGPERYPSIDAWINALDFQIQLDANLAFVNPADDAYQAMTPADLYSYDQWVYSHTQGGQDPCVQRAEGELECMTETKEADRVAALLRNLRTVNKEDMQ